MFKMIIYKTMHFQQSTRSYFYQLMDCVIFQLFPVSRDGFSVFSSFFSSYKKALYTLHGVFDGALRTDHQKCY